MRLMWKRREIGKEKLIQVVGSAMARAYVVNRAAISGEGTLYFLPCALEHACRLLICQI